MPGPVAELPQKLQGKLLNLPYITKDTLLLPTASKLKLNDRVLTFLFLRSWFHIVIVG
jgi:hypothetical protein